MTTTINQKVANPNFPTGGASGTTGTGNLVFSESPTLTGNVSANVNLRADTLANLLPLAGGTSEIGYATDTNSLVLFDGVAGEAKVNGNYGTGIAKVLTLDINNVLRYTRGSTSFQGTISGTILTVTSIQQGADVVLIAGTTVGKNSFVNSEFTILNQLTSSGTAVATLAYASGGAILDNTITLASVTGIVVGQLITGTGVPTGTFVQSINSNTITISNLLTAQASGNYAFYTAGGNGTYTTSVSQSTISTPFGMTAFNNNGNYSYIDCNHVSYLQINLDASLYNPSPYFDLIYTINYLNIRLPNSNEIPEFKVVWNMGESTAISWNIGQLIYSLAYQPTESRPFYTSIASDWYGSSTATIYSPQAPTISNVSTTIPFAVPNVTFFYSYRYGWSRYARDGESFLLNPGVDIQKIGYSQTTPSYVPYLPSVTATSTTGQIQSVQGLTTQSPLIVNQQILITGTLTGTATGISAGTYYVIAVSSNTSTSNGVTYLFTLSTTLGGAAITTTAGTVNGLTFTALMPVGTSTLVTENLPGGIWLTTGSYSITNNSSTTAFTSGEINITLAGTANTISTATSNASVKTYNIPAGGKEFGILPTRVVVNTSNYLTGPFYTLINVASISSGAASIAIIPRFIRIA